MTDPVTPDQPAGVTPADRGPIGGDMARIVGGLASRFSIASLSARYNSTNVMGLFAGINGLIAIAIMSAVAWASGEPFIFPSLGPTAFMLFYTPTVPAAAPRNTIIGHAVGVGAGYLSLAIFGLSDAPAAMATQVSGGRAGAAAVSLALTSAVMVWVRAPHPPAGATTLIVSLGILRGPQQLAILMLAVVLLTVQGFVINRLAGIDYPIWRHAATPKPADTSQP